MVIGFRTRRALALAVVGSSLLAWVVAEPQIDTSNGTTVMPGTARTEPPTAPAPRSPVEDPRTNTGVGGSGPADDLGQPGGPDTATTRPAPRASEDGDGVDGPGVSPASEPSRPAPPDTGLPGR